MTTTELANPTGTELANQNGHESNFKLPRVFFLSDRAKGEALERAKAGGVTKDSFYLCDDLGARAFSPFRIVPTPFVFDCYVELDDDNNVVHAQYEKPDDNSLSEYRTGLVLVVEPDESEVTPALLTTNRALCRLWKSISDAVQLSFSGSKWFNRGPAFKATDVTEFPYFRVQANIRAAKTKPKTEGGREYYLGSAAVSPTSAKLIKTLEAFNGSPVAEAAAQAFKRQAGWLQKKIDGE